MKNAFKISKSAFIDALIHGAVILAATFLVGFFNSLDGMDLFVNVDVLVIKEAAIDGVNKCWQLFYAAVLPLIVSLTRWDKA